MKFNFSTKFQILEKFVYLMWTENMCTKSFFPFGGGPNLVFRRGRKDKIFFLRTPAAVKFFHPNCQKNDTLM